MNVHCGTPDSGPSPTYAEIIEAERDEARRLTVTAWRQCRQDTIAQAAADPRRNFGARPASSELWLPVLDVNSTDHLFVLWQRTNRGFADRVVTCFPWFVRELAGATEAQLRVIWHFPTCYPIYVERTREIVQ